MINVFKYEMNKSFDAAAAAATDYYVNRNCKMKQQRRQQHEAYGSLYLKR